ncbi:DUF3626 domain-containing protein [Corallococcus sp. bb12-1]|uniref:DUF3626 domain-containing protein n=1 Tax=Corallococcus sp. bb12-1 TaxID=2996784 RepID=UPI0022703971|nr:DUF3626 domain-containing protein [Corallococcus sp. bb12-1]MCY1047047.1 DUF3626 domain-containing protein [Corallococcus sp. bb12-1]
MPCNLCPEPKVHGIAYCPEAHVILRYCQEHYAQHSGTAQTCFLCGQPLRWAHEEAADHIIKGFGAELGRRAHRVNGPLRPSPVASSMEQLGASIGAPSLAVIPKSSGVLSSISGPSPVIETTPPKVMGVRVWIRCPYGCFFEASAKRPLKIDRADNTLRCTGCNLVSPAKQFKTVRNASVLDAVENARAFGVKEKLDDIKAAVSARLTRLVGSWFWFFEREQRIEQLYAQLRDLLISSEITSNFPTPRIYGLIASGFMKNMWHFNKSDKSKYAQERDQGERQVFGKLFKGISTPIPFPDWRPVYVALNLGNRLPGPCPNYGRSYLIYKDAVKARATFLATDSLQMIKAELQKKEGDRQPVDEKALATLVNIAKVLLRVSDRQLLYMCGMLVEGKEVPSPNEFIEVHVWGEIALMKDVKTMVVSEADIDDFIRLKSTEVDVLPQFYNELTTEQRRQETHRLKSMIKEFCATYGIELHLIPLGSDTMNSMERRPPAPKQGSDAKQGGSFAPARVPYTYTIPEWEFDPKNPKAVPNRVLQDAKSGLYSQYHRIVINGHGFTVHLFDVEPTNDNWNGTGVYLSYRLRGG